MNHLTIFIGKYIDQITEQIPDEDIDLRQCGDFSRRVEPGAPNLPTSSTYTFALTNRDYDASQKYPMSWWTSRERTAQEGAIQPLQIYVRVSVLGERQFLGIVKSIRYSTFQTTCFVTVGDVLDSVRTSERPMLLSFEFPELRCRSAIPANTGPSNPLPDVQSLDGQTVAQRALQFQLNGEGPLSAEFGQWLAEWGTGVSHGWVQIEEITLLTRIHLFTAGAGASQLHLLVWHNHDDPYGDITPRGQFLDRNGARLDQQLNPDRVTLTLHVPAAGDLTSCVVHRNDTPLAANFIFGFPYTDQGTHLQITSAAYGYFDVIQTTIDIANRELNRIHSIAQTVFFFDTEFLLSQRQFVFWGDLIMYGWAGATLADALTRMAHQVSAWIHMDRGGQMALHSRGQLAFQNTNRTAVHEVPNQDIEPLDGDRNELGRASYEATTPQDIIEVNNVVTQDQRTWFVAPEGAIDGPTLRNQSVRIDNYRIRDLGVPSGGDLEPQPVFRYSPGNPLWPGPGLSEFLPTPEGQLLDIAQSMPWPTTTSSIRLRLDWLVSPPGQITRVVDVGHYLQYDDNSLWWIRSIRVSPDSLTADCEVQRVGPVVGPECVLVTSVGDRITTGGGGIGVECPEVSDGDVLMTRMVLTDHSITDNVSLVLGQADDAQMVYESSEAWESDFVAGTNQVITDHEGHLRLYYEIRDTSTQRRGIALMRSTDRGQTWSKVRQNLNPGIVDDPDSNLIFIEAPFSEPIDRVSAVSVYYDPIAQNYKMVGKWQSLAGWMVWSSADGMSFTGPVEVVASIAGDDNPQSIFYDGSGWVITGRTRGPDASAPGPPTPYSGRRWAIYNTSPNWNDSPYTSINNLACDPANEYSYGNQADNPAFWTSFTDGCGDGWDPDTPGIRPDLYMGNITFYNGIYIAYFPVFFRHDERVPRSNLARTTGPIYPVLAWSDNLTTWTFPNNTTPAINLTPYLRSDTNACATSGDLETGQLNSGFTFATLPDQVNGIHVVSALNRTQTHYQGSGSGNTNLPDTRSIWTQTLREDGFASLQASSEGSWTSQPFTMPQGARHLLVNANTTGHIRGEIINPNTSQPYTAFSYNDSAISSGNFIELIIHWPNSGGITQLWNLPVQIKIYWSGGHIYAFRIKDN